MGKTIDLDFDKQTNTYNISIQFKMSLQSLIDNPKELLELVNECLQPKNMEKKKFGEVFTPMKIVNEMLDELPKEIWTNKKLKWYDPASGMGNYPIAIYLRLMKSLRDVIEDDSERKKHILENMLYMSELNKKNVMVCRQIFDINNEYKLNIYCGDSLDIDIRQIFGVKRFDIVIGNPPYNEEFTKAGAKPLYNKFIEYYVSKCNMLSFIVPSRWFSGGKGLDKFRGMMLSRTDIVYIKHFEDATKIFGNLVDIKGGVNYFLIDNRYNDMCNFNGTYMNLDKYDIFCNNVYYNIIDKLCEYESINTLYIGRYFGIESNDKRLSDNKNDVHDIKCYVSKQKGFIKYIDRKEINKEYEFYKVITTEASYKGKSGFGNTFIGKINEVHTGSYVSFRVNNKTQAESL
jgi:hypothetical protein